MIKSLLVLFDNSRESGKALETALKLCKQLQASLQVMYVTEQPVPAVPLYQEMGMSTTTLEPMLTKIDLQRHMTDFISRFDTHGIEMYLDSEDLDDVKAAVMSSGADMVLMGGGNPKNEVSSVLSTKLLKLVRSSPIPLFIIKDKKVPDFAKPIVCATTFDESQDNTVMFLKEFTAATGQQLHLVYVNTPLYFRNTQDLYRDKEQFEKKYSLVGSIFEIINHSDVVEGVLYYAEKIGAETVIIPTHQRSGLSLLLEGSFAEEIVLSKSDMSVITLPLAAHGS